MLNTAIASLLVQDVLPGGYVVVEALRWVCLVFLSLAVLALLVARKRVQEQTGTLYYVRLLRPGLVDQHLGNLRDASRELSYLDVRALTPPLIMTCAPGGAGYDVAEDVHRLAADFQAISNGDVLSTGFDLAPNIEFPASLAFGYELFLWRDFRFAEALSNPRQDERPPSPLLFSPAATDATAVAQMGFDCVTTTSESEDEATGPVLIEVLLTDGPLSSPERAEEYSTRVLIGVADCCGRLRPVRVSDSPTRVPDDDAGNRALTEPAHAAFILAVSILRVAHEHPNRTLVLVGRLPKSVAVAAGWWLSQPTAPRPCTTPDQRRAVSAPCLVCPDLWQHLVPLYWDQALRSLVPMRVHRAQPVPLAGVLP